MTEREWKVPESAFKHMITSTGLETAEYIAKTYKPSDVAHPGDPFGDVMDWLWKADEQQAVQLFTTVLGSLHLRVANVRIKVIFEDLLVGLPMALKDLSGEERKRLKAAIRRYVEGTLSGDDNW